MTWTHQNHRGAGQHPDKHLWAHSAAPAKGSPPRAGTSGCGAPDSRPAAQEPPATGPAAHREPSPSNTETTCTRKTGPGPGGQLCPPPAPVRRHHTELQVSSRPWHDLPVRPGGRAWEQSLLDLGPAPAPLPLRPPPSPGTAQREIPFCRVCALDSFPRFTWKPLPRDGVLPAPRNTKQTDQPKSSGAALHRQPSLSSGGAEAQAGHTLPSASGSCLEAETQPPQLLPWSQRPQGQLHWGKERRLLAGAGMEPVAGGRAWR